MTPFTVRFSNGNEILLLHYLLLAVTGVEIFFIGARLFGRAVLFASPIGHAKNGHSKSKCTSDGDTTRNIAFLLHR